MPTTIISNFPQKVNKRMNDREDFRLVVCFIALLFVVTGLSVLYISTREPKEDFVLKAEPIKQVTAAEIVEEVTEAEEEEPKAPILSDQELIAMVVMAEAGNQDMLGKVAVASVVLNRCNYFGLTVESVVSAKGQFAFPYYGTVSEDCYRAVEIAEQSRDLFPATMLYFRNTKYHDFGIPYEQIGDHFFSLIESED
jgi:hypothetical protein